jgi:hypothetical protein
MGQPSYRNRAQIWQKHPDIGQALDDIHALTTQGLQQVGVNISGKESQAPPQISALSVTGADGVADVLISDNNPITRAIEYHVEYSETPDFKQPSGFSLGAWRTDRRFVGNKTLYWRAYSQYNPVSPPSAPVYMSGSVYHGGTLAGPAIQKSTGSGTAPGDGLSGGQGAGKLPTRGTPTAV